MLAQPFQLVRHIEWSREDDAPTHAGLEQLGEARTQLAGVLGGGAVILSSEAERAMFTARELSADIGAVVFPSRRIMLGGLQPNGIRDLDAFVGLALEEAQAQLEGRSLIVVTHQPLMDIATGHRTANGEVATYVPGTWSNPGFRPVFETGLERRIAGELGF